MKRRVSILWTCPVAAEDDKNRQCSYESDVWKSIPAVQQNHILKVDEAAHENEPDLLCLVVTVAMTG